MRTAASSSFFLLVNSVKFFTRVARDWVEAKSLMLEVKLIDIIVPPII